MGRFEYRYFNGVQWKWDVSVNGQRYVDAPVSQIVPQVRKGPTEAAGHGNRIVRHRSMRQWFIGWVPFVFVLAAAGAITAIVFGILGLKTARRHDGYGRGSAVAGLVLSPVALAACVGGFFFTKAVVRELREFAEPGPARVDRRPAVHS